MHEPHVMTLKPLRMEIEYLARRLRMLNGGK